ncbi:MAG TPA: ParM/StbA family protein [Symbiobacteriaceae bacterium]|jgi:plasmid segregation protein ParM|nr:ParM/StbA family protein [Symbiobacteriaceae bacterium]
MERCIGIDVGYGFVKITDGQEGYLFPSVVGEGSTDLAPRMGLQAPARTDDLRLVVDGKVYNVGNLAIRHSRLAHRGLSATRMEGNTFKVLLLAGLSLFCHQPLNSFAVVTGLPPGRMHLTEEVTRQVRGEHRIVRLGAAGPEELTIRIDRVNVVPQPLGTYWSQVLDTRGKVKDETALLRGTTGIIDVGFRTCDLATIKEGDYVPELSRTIPTGMVAAYEEIAAGLLVAHGIERETYALDEAVIRGEIAVAGRRVDITALRDQAFEHLGIKLLVEVQSAWQIGEFDTLLLSGGGCQAVSRHLLPHLPQGLMPTDPATTNARGYVAWANRLWNPAGATWTDRNTTA